MSEPKFRYIIVMEDYSVQGTNNKELAEHESALNSVYDVVEGKVVALDPAFETDMLEYIAPEEDIPDVKGPNDRYEASDLVGGQTDMPS